METKTIRGIQYEETMRVTSRIPPIYRPPFGLPLRWQDDESGVLPSAVRAYIDDRLGGCKATPEQIELVRDYLQHFICAPCWNESARNDEELAATLIKLRIDVVKKHVSTADEIYAWIHRCLDIGIDPL